MVLGFIYKIYNIEHIGMSLPEIIRKHLDFGNLSKASLISRTVISITLTDPHVESKLQMLSDEINIYSNGVNIDFIFLLIYISIFIL